MHGDEATGATRRGGARPFLGSVSAATSDDGDDGATTGDDRREDGEGVSRGGTPAPLSAQSGATTGGRGRG